MSLDLTYFPEIITRKYKIAFNSQATYKMQNHHSYNYPYYNSSVMITSPTESFYMSLILIHKNDASIELIYV